MTDLEQLKAMLDRARIEYTVSKEDRAGKPGATLTVARGYDGFETDFYFTADGTLTDMGAFE